MRILPRVRVREMLKLKNKMMGSRMKKLRKCKSGKGGTEVMSWRWKERTWREKSWSNLRKKTPKTFPKKSTTTKKTMINKIMSKISQRQYPSPSKTLKKVKT